MLMVVLLFFETSAPSDMIITRFWTASTNRSRGRAARDYRKWVRWPKRGQGQFFAIGVLLLGMRVLLKMPIREDASRMTVRM
jgi:hypothetical protein